MEALKNEKFSCLSTNEMNEIHGGKWGMVITNVQTADGGYTRMAWEVYNIWGRMINSGTSLVRDN